MRQVFSPNIYQYLASISGTFSLISYGACIGWTSPFLPYLQSEESPIPISNEEASWLALANTIGCPVGATIAGILAGNLGRKRFILLMAPIVVVCNIFIAFINNIWILYIMRFTIGVAEGVSYTILPTYIAEISSPEIRGFLSSLVTINYLLGILVINVIGSFWSIRTCGLLINIVPIVHFFTFILMPESPYWYIKINQYQEAEKSLQVFRGTKNVQKQLDVIKEAIEAEKIESKQKFTDLFTIPSNRKASIIVIVMCLQQKATAKTPVLLFTKTIFEETGSSISSSLSTIVYSSVEILVVIIMGYFIVDRFGKKILCVISVLGCIGTLTIIATYFLFKDLQLDLIKYLDWVPLTAFVIFSIFYSVGISFLPFGYACELFPTGVRACALTMTEVTMSFGSITSGKFFHMLESYTGSFCVPFFTSAGVTIVLFIFVLQLVPETKGKTLEEIQLYLKQKKK